MISNSGVGTPASAKRILLATLSKARRLDSTPAPVNGIPRFSSSAWSCPSSPERAVDHDVAESGAIGENEVFVRDVHRDDFRHQLPPIQLPHSLHFSGKPGVQNPDLLEVVRFFRR